ncbi:hypothetical protein M422DRAFT_238658 [Sphaerobolus stellatus SS14]|nr:hypothetical protein M422DRAFT_238658 [Sphaerobolus stellatus SS14]
MPRRRPSVVPTANQHLDGDRRKPECGAAGLLHLPPTALSRPPPKRASRLIFLHPPATPSFSAPISVAPLDVFTRRSGPVWRGGGFPTLPSANSYPRSRMASLAKNPFGVFPQLTQNIKGTSSPVYIFHPHVFPNTALPMYILDITSIIYNWLYLPLASHHHA